MSRVRREELGVRSETLEGLLFCRCGVVLGPRAARQDPDFLLTPHSSPLTSHP